MWNAYLQKAFEIGSAPKNIHSRVNPKKEMMVDLEETTNSYFKANPERLNHYPPGNSN
jgi:hypothetical protein